MPRMLIVIGLVLFPFLGRVAFWGICVAGGPALRSPRSRVAQTLGGAILLVAALAGAWIAIPETWGLLWGGLAIIVLAFVFFNEAMFVLVSDWNQIG